MNLKRRIAALEGHGPRVSSARVRAWLGLPVTDAELAAEPPFEPATVDGSGWSKELKAWLGLD